MGSRHSSHAEDPALQKQIMALRFHEPAVSAHLTPGRNRYYRSPFGLSAVLLVPLPDIIGPDRVYSICMNESCQRAWSQLPCIAHHSEHSVPSV